ncbi:MAG: nucleoside deaminase [Bacilli bacterium]|jgi:tRNA(adenine34) deaminase|nr:nucleoside deaminase [Bacilli bacterium]
MRDIKYMKVALKQAQLALQEDEVPVGAIIVYQDKIIAQAHNMNQQLNSPLAHAEILVIKQASEYLKSKDLSQCQLYVTLEPCLMCTGAIINSRLEKVIFGAFDLDNGSIISNEKKECKKILWVPNILQEECSKILSNYFARKRVE